MQSRLASRLLGCSLVALAACGIRKAPGSAEVHVAFQRGTLTEASVNAVNLTITGDDGIAPIHASLVKTAGTWSGIIGGIPSGNHNRNFHADALSDANDPTSVIYVGDATAVTIVAYNTTVVSILLQPQNPVQTPPNSAPVIDSLTVSSNAAAPGDTLSLSVVAHDPDAGETATLTYLWSTSGTGTFEPTTLRTPATSWTAPSTTGPQTLTITVTDIHGAFTAQSLTITVAASAGSGTADVAVKLNTFPLVDSISATPTELPLTAPGVVSVIAEDPDGDPITYSWSSNCAVTWGDATAQSTPFTVTALAAHTEISDCRLTVDIDDGRGGQNFGYLDIHIGSPPGAEYPPTIDGTYQSSPAAYNGELVNLRVSAHDPSAAQAAVTFQWTAVGGTLGTPDNSTPGVSAIAFSPQCTVNGGSSVTATITNTSGGATAVRTFPIASCTTSCKDLLAKVPALAGVSGLHYIDPDGAAANAPFQTYCDMVTDGGGWTFLAHVDANYTPSIGLWTNDVGTYQSDRRDDGTTYGRGASILPFVQHSEMMVTIDSPDPIVANGRHDIAFFKYAVGDAAFNNGPVPCVSTGAGFSYKVSIGGEFTSGGTISTCDTQGWYTLNAAATPQYLVLFGNIASIGYIGQYDGQGLGGNGDEPGIYWRHVGFWYVR